MEYRWVVQIDVDNDRNTGFGGGYEYLLSAYHIAFLLESRENHVAPISNGLESDIWENWPHKDYDCRGSEPYCLRRG